MSVAAQMADTFAPYRHGNRWMLHCPEPGVTLIAGPDRSVALVVDGEEVEPGQMHLITALGGEAPAWSPWMTRLENWSRHGERTSPVDGLTYAASAPSGTGGVRRRPELAGRSWFVTRHQWYANASPLC